MKQYPSIPYGGSCAEKVVVFDKLDGSNIRAEWSKKKGWTKFGSRNQLICEESGILRKAELLICQKYGDDLSKIFIDQKYSKAVAFFEFCGSSSFAGSHAENEEHTVTLLDVSPHQTGILSVFDFVKIFDKLDMPTILHTGPVSHEMILSVQNGTLEGMTFEGVVCKGYSKRKKQAFMFKQKNKAWIKKLKQYCGDNETKFRSLL